MLSTAAGNTKVNSKVNSFSFKMFHKMFEDPKVKEIKQSSNRNEGCIFLRYKIHPDDFCGKPPKIAKKAVIRDNMRQPVSLSNIAMTLNHMSRSVQPFDKQFDTKSLVCYGRCYGFFGTVLSCNVRNPAIDFAGQGSRLESSKTRSRYETLQHSNQKLCPQNSVCVCSCVAGKGMHNGLV